MNNVDDTIKKILRNMGYNPKKTLKEQEDEEKINILPSVKVTAKKTDGTPTKGPTSTEGNGLLNDYKMTNCKTGELIVSPLLTPIKKYKEITGNEWYQWQSSLLEKKEANYISACKYYAMILVEQQKKNLGAFALPDPFSEKFQKSEEFYKKQQEINKRLEKPIKYDEEVQTCLKASYAAIYSRPDGCITSFWYQDKSGSTPKKIIFTRTDWWGTEYKKFSNDNNYTPKSPAETATMSRYSFEGQSVEVSITDLSITKDTENLKNTYMISDALDTSTSLPLTKAELETISKSPIDKNNEFVGGQYVCKKPDSAYVNLRSSAEVNEDRGWFDPTDNYVNWSGDDIVGKYLKSITTEPYYDVDQHKTFINSLDQNDFDLWRNKVFLNMSKLPEVCKKMIELGSDWKGAFKKRVLSSYSEFTFDIVKAPNFKELMPKELYDRLPKSRFSRKWYKVELSKPLTDVSEFATNIDADVYKTVWVAGENVTICPKPDPNSESTITDYNIELLKRMPIKPLKDPTIKTGGSYSPSDAYKKYKQSPRRLEPGKI